MGYVAGVPNTFNGPNEVDEYYIWNLSGSYDINDNSQFFFAINNLFDEDLEIAPPLSTGISNNGGGGSITNPVFYDQIGRQFRIGMRFDFRVTLRQGGDKLVARRGNGLPPR